MSDKLFHRRRAKARNALRRRKALRDSYDRALIVCEGTKTEPKYFSDWRNKLRLNSANIEVLGDCGSDPMSVVNHAIEIFEEDQDYDRVFCVVDRDTHANFDDAVRKANDQDPDVFTLIKSVPCFEYWLILHYQYTTRGYTTAQAIAETRRYIPGYSKGQDGVMAETAATIEKAITHAKRARKGAAREGFDNPFTNLDELVVYLRSIKT